MEKSYKLRIYPNKEQEILIQKTFGCCRFVYNYFLDLKQKLYKDEHITLSYNDTSKILTVLKSENEWLKEPDKCSLQSSLKDLDNAYKNFFRGKGYPKFKSKKNHYKSYRSNSNIHIFDRYIQLPKLGKVRFRGKYKIEGRILNATVTQESSGKYFVAITVIDYVPEQLPKTNQSIGIDLGLKDFAILSNGIKIKNYKFLRNFEKRLALEQRRLSRKTRGSKNYEKQRIKVARAYDRVSNQRKDFLQKLSTELVKDCDIICTEDLNVQGMVKNHKLAKAISDASWSMFTRMLEYKCNWYGKQLIKVDRFYPSSQLCSNCGFKNTTIKDLKIRYWECPNCSSTVDRDINASINILNGGLQLVSL